MVSYLNILNNSVASYELDGVVPLITDPPPTSSKKLLNLKQNNCRSPDFKSPTGPTKNLERHYNRVVGWSVGWLVGCNAGYNRLIPF